MQDAFLERAGRGINRHDSFYETCYFMKFIEEMILEARCTP